MNYFALPQQTQLTCVYSGNITVAILSQIKTSFKSVCHQHQRMVRDLGRTQCITRWWADSDIPPTFHVFSRAYSILCCHIFTNRTNYFLSLAALPSLICFNGILWSAVKQSAAHCSAKAVLGRALYSLQRLYTVQKKFFCKMPNNPGKYFFFWVGHSRMRGTCRQQTVQIWPSFYQNHVFCMDTMYQTLVAIPWFQCMLT